MDSHDANWILREQMPNSGSWPQRRWKKASDARSIGIFLTIPEWLRVRQIHDYPPHALLKLCDRYFDRKIDSGSQPVISSLQNAMPSLQGSFRRSFTSPRPYRETYPQFAVRSRLPMQEMWGAFFPAAPFKKQG